MTDLAAKRARFRDLHRAGFFVIPNPWDVGGVRKLEARGFPAIATTSAGHAWSLGVQDYEITLDDALRHLDALCASTSLPVNADFENGFADDPADVARNVTRALATGIAGISIEDRRRNDTLYERDAAAARVAAASAAIAASGTGVMLVARCEAYLVERPDIDEVIARLRSFVAAGADCVYAPGVRDLGELRRIVDAVAPVPVNVNYYPDSDIEALAAAGVRRMSLGSALAKAAWNGVDRFLDDLSAPAARP